MDKQTKYIIVKFIKFVNTNLNLNNPYRVQLSFNRDNKLKTYAYYDPKTCLIRIYCKDRGVADILRSVAHELVHHHQNQENKLNRPIQDIGGSIEDEANGVAGQLVKKFGYANPMLSIYGK